MDYFIPLAVAKDGARISAANVIHRMIRICH